MLISAVFHEGCVYRAHRDFALVGMSRTQHHHLVRSTWLSMLRGQEGLEAVDICARAETSEAFKFPVQRTGILTGDTGPSQLTKGRQYEVNSSELRDLEGSKSVAFHGISTIVITVYVAGQSNQNMQFQS